MKEFPHLKRIFLLSFVIFAWNVLAANPSQPFLPSDNVQDPNCTPLDSNCYVRLTSFDNETVTGLDYSTSTGVLSLTSGYTIPTTASTTAWDSAIGALGGSALLQNGNSFGTTLTLGTNDNNALNFETNGTSKMTILANGNIGVGTSTPSYLFDVNGSARIFGTLNLSAGNSTGGLSVNGAGTLLLNSSNSAGATVYGELAPSGNGGALGDAGKRWDGYFTGINSSGVLTLSSTTATHTLGNLSLVGGTLSNGGGLTLSAQTAVLTTGTGYAVTLDNNGFYPSSATVNFGTAAKPWNAGYFNGNVGIGTTNPLATLHIQSSAQQGFLMKNSLYSTGISLRSYYPSIGLNRYNDGGTDRYIGTGYASDWELNPSTGALNYNTYSTGVADGTLSGGSAKFTILNSGNVGVGTSNPLNKLDVNGTTAIGLGTGVANGQVAIRPDSSSQFWFGSGALNGTTTTYLESAWVDSAGAPLYSRDIAITGKYGGNVSNFTINSNNTIFNGKIGIGTTTPGSVLTIKSTTSIGGSLSIGNIPVALGTTAVVIATPNTTNEALTLYGQSGQVASLFSIRDYTGSSYFGVSPTGGNMSGAWSLGGGGSFTVSTGSAGDDLIRLGNVAAGGKNYYLGSRSDGSFRIRDNSSSTDRFMIDTSGNVGIGTTTPQYSLDVNGSSVFRNHMYVPGNSTIYNAGGSNGTNIVNGNTQLSIGHGGGSNITLSGSGYLDYQIGGSSKMRVISNGNVGIGTTTPNELLSIAGNINLTGALKINGNAGTLGQVLQSTGTGVQWVATSTLGISGGGSGSGTVNLGDLGQLSFYAANSTTTLSGTSTLIASNGSSLRVTTAAAASIGLIVKGSSSQTANLFEAQDSAGSIKMYVGSDGSVISNGNIGGAAYYFGSSGGFGSFTRDTGGSASLTIASQNAVGANIIMQIGNGGSSFLVKAASSQTANIQEWRNSGGTALVVVTAAGSLGVGTTTPADKLQVFGDVRLGTAGANGCIKDFGGTGIIGSCSSDERLKTNIVDLSDGYLDKMAKLRVITYNWNDTAKDLNKVDTTLTNYGLLAQNVEENFPELVTTDSNGYKQVNYSRLSLYLLKSVQELTKKFEKVYAWFANDKFNVQSDVCVDDYCITKSQFKQMLINSQNGNTTTYTPPVTAPVVNEPVNPPTEEPVVDPVVEPTPEPVVEEPVVVPEVPVEVVVPAPTE